MTLRLALLALLLACSAFFSGAETALFSLSRHELTTLARHPRASHRLVADLMRKPRKLLLTLMIGNVTINTFIFAASLSLFQSLGEGTRWVAFAPALGLISPLLVTLFGEILPKGTSIEMRTRVAPRLAPAVRVFQLLLTPLSGALNLVLIEPLTRLVVGGRRPDPDVSIEELHELVEMSERRHVIDADENAMLSEVIQLEELEVRDVMVPRVDMTAFEINDDPDALRRLMREHRFAKLPVYEGDIDHVVGLIYGKDLFLDRDRPLVDLVKPVPFVPDLITLTQLLAHYRRTRTQMAIVVNEYGGVVGVVSVEDVAEQIVGELTLPEEASDQPAWERIDPRRYRVAGRVSVRDWSVQFHVRALAERATTLAGLVVSLLGRIPQVGDQVQIGNLTLTVEAMERRRVTWILLELADDERPAAVDEATKGTGP